MKNRCQCEGELRYNSFSVILLQTFTTPGLRKPSEKEPSPFARSLDAGATPAEREKNIDRQLFTHAEQVVERYELDGFDIRIVIGEKGKGKSGTAGVPDGSVPSGAEPSDAELYGHVHVRAAVFFDATVQISYRMVVSRCGKIRNSCSTNRPFSTDELIAVAGLAQQVEHWNYNAARRQQEISETIKSVRISNMRLDASSEYVPKGTGERGLTIEDVMARYRGFFDRASLDELHYKDLNYTYIDIWEDVAHSGGDVDFDRMGEDEIIEHIETCHQAELNGLMSLYPKEWPYRTETSFTDICGSNIAIDTDDLVLANQNVCVVFGTYGKRGEEAPTDWREHLKRREFYQVSWPEFLIILEILLAKKQTINYVLNKYAFTSKRVIQENTCDSIRQIEQNAQLCIRMSNILLHLDSISYLRFMSHKHMYAKTSRNLRIGADERRMKEAMNQIDQALVNVDNIVRARQGEITKNILYFISIASLFGVLLQNEHVPLFSLISRKLGIISAAVIFTVTIFIIGYGVNSFLKEYRYRRHNRKM